MSFNIKAAEFYWAVQKWVNIHSYVQLLRLVCRSNSHKFLGFIICSNSCIWTLRVCGRDEIAPECQLLEHRIRSVAPVWWTISVITTRVVNMRVAIILFGLLDLIHAYHYHDGGGGQSSPFILPRKAYIMILWSAYFVCSKNNSLHFAVFLNLLSIHYDTMLTLHFVWMN